MNFDDPLAQLFPGLAGAQLPPFSSRYKCYSIAMYQQSHASDEKVAELEHGGKILLPHSALDYLTRQHIDYPMLFKITNVNANHQRITHAGVIEFHQEEGKCYMPYWMMRNLLLTEGEYINVDYTRLPVGSYVKFRPQSPDFLDITNPRAVLELRLRNFSCLTKSDMIAIAYNNKIYEFLVEELKPANAVSIIECDMNVEFSPPVGYVDPEPVKPVSKPAQPETTPILSPSNAFVPFTGKGYRSDGKQKPTPADTESKNITPGTPVHTDSASAAIPKQPRGIPDYDYKPGTLTFSRDFRPEKVAENGTEADKKSQAFFGKGHTIRDSKKL